MKLNKTSKELSRLALKALPFGRTANDLIELVQSISSSGRELDEQVEEAVNALTTSTKLIADLEDSLNERAKKLKDIQAKYEKISQLASLSEEQSKAITDQLEDVLGKNSFKRGLTAFFLNLLAGLVIFILGVFAADWVKDTSKVFDGVDSAIVQEQTIDNNTTEKKPTPN